MTRAFDVLIAACVALWLSGGIPWGDRILIRHGADPRRAAIVLMAMGYLCLPNWRTRSFWLRLCTRVWRFLQRPRAIAWVLAGVTAWAAIVGVLQMRALRYSLFDVGIFHQILWNLSRLDGFGSTISGAGNFLQDHLSPSLALLVPGYWLMGRIPEGLPIIHALLLFGGAGAWIWFAHKKGGARLAAATLIFVVGLDSLWGNLRWGFHENSIYFCAASWALALAAANKIAFWRPLGLFVVASLSKEIALLDISVVFLVWAWIGREHSRLKRVLLAILAGVLIAGFVIFQRLPHPAEKNYFARYYSYLGPDLATFAVNLWLHPGRVIDHVGGGALLVYVKEVFRPWLFMLPFVSGGPAVAWLLALLPSFASAALSSYAALRNPGFHYVLELWPVLAVTTVLGLSRISTRFPKAPLVWALLSGLALDQDPVNQMREFGREAHSRSELRSRLSELPEHAIISANDGIGTWLSGRSELWRYPDHGVGCPDFWVIRESESPDPLCESGLLKDGVTDGWAIWKKAN